MRYGKWEGDVLANVGIFDDANTAAAMGFTIRLDTLSPEPGIGWLRGADGIPVPPPVAPVESPPPVRRVSVFEFLRRLGYERHVAMEFAARRQDEVGAEVTALKTLLLSPMDGMIELDLPETVAGMMRLTQLKRMESDERTLLTPEEVAQIRA